MTPGNLGPKSRNEIITQCLRRKSGAARTRFIWSAGRNLALSWRIGFRPNVSSRLSSAAQSGLYS